MQTPENTITRTKVKRWYLMVNVLLIALIIYTHYLLTAVGHGQGNNFIEYTGLWLLAAFKIIGANCILHTVFAGFKIIK